MSLAKNRFDVQVAFKDFSFGIQNNKKLTLTPENVVRALEDFCARVRVMIEKDGDTDKDNV